MTNDERPAPPTNKGKRLPPEPLTKDETRQLLAKASTRSSSGLRMRGLIGVLYGAGLRLGEALALRPSDVDIDACVIRVAEGKGGKYRTVGIDAFCAGLVERWTAERKMLGLTGRMPLFCVYKGDEKGKPLQQRYVRAALARLGRKAGLDKRVHPHGLRHSLASQLANEGKSTYTIQAQLGHGSLATTDRYIRRLRPQELIDTMRERTWHDED